MQKPRGRFYDNASHCRTRRTEGSEREAANGREHAIGNKREAAHEKQQTGGSTQEAANRGQKNEALERISTLLYARTRIHGPACTTLIRDPVSTLPHPGSLSSIRFLHFRIQCLCPQKRYRTLDFSSPVFKDAEK